MKMMNVIALFLAVSSLVAAGVWSPTPEKQNPREEVIVKEGHRVIVVEYAKEGLRNTKVSISPQDPEMSHKPETDSTGILDNAKETFKEASSVLPNLGQGVSISTPPRPNVQSPSPGEIICDAFNKCKHKVAGGFGKAKEKVSEKTHQVEEGTKEAFETVKEKADQVEEGAKEIVDKAKHAGKDAVDKTKSIGEDVASNISEKVKIAREQVVGKAKEAEEIAEKMVDRVKTSAEEGQKNLTEILRRGREVAYDAAMYAVSPESMNSLMGMLHLLGFATGYGICVWVTFVSSHVLAEALPRQQFGMVQSKIYPVYFRAMACCIGVSLLSHRRRLLSSQPETLQGYNLLASLVMVLSNLLYLEPRATKVMFERMKMEKEESRGRADADGVDEQSPVTGTTTTTTAAARDGFKRSSEPRTTASTAATPSPGKVGEKEAMTSKFGELNQRLKRLNTYSSFLNLMALMSLTWHLVYLGQRLHMTC